MKRPFVLTEVIIALSILAIAAFPLISHPIKVYSQELLTLQNRELDRTFEKVLFDLTANVEKSLPFEEISQEGFTLSLGKYTIDLGELGTFSYNAKCLAKQQKPKTDSQNLSNKLISLEIALLPTNKKAPRPPTVTYLLHLHKSSPQEPT